MSIYTKSGDKGETGLLGGRRVSKSDPRIEAIGAVDELNAHMGMLATLSLAKDEILKQVQDDLFTLGAQLADPDRQPDSKQPAVNQPGIEATHVKYLEQRIDELEAKLPPLKQFILPGGTPFASHAHMARAVCRRAERSVVALHKKTPIGPHTIEYLNRLSDLLFMLAREEMHDKKIKEIPWRTRLQGTS